MKDNIIKNIRKNNIMAFFVFLLIGGFCDVMFFMYLYNMEMDGSWFMLIFFGFMGVVLSYVCVKSLLVVIDPYKSDIFKKYGTSEELEKILQEIENTIEYQDDKIIVAQNYVADKNDYERILAYKDILRVHKLVHKTNFVIDGYSVVITDKYNQEVRYSYSAKEEEKVNGLLVMIGSKCDNAKFGYTKEAEQYVKENKVELPPEPVQVSKNEVSNIKQVNYACPDCRNNIEVGDKFCKNCGCKIDWN